jgi:hypothetical protein
MRGYFMQRITVAIQDDFIEKRLHDLMQVQHKPASEIILDALRKFLGGDESSSVAVKLEVPKLSVVAHSKIITFEGEEVLPDGDSVKPFSHVKHTARYAKKLREESWQ